ncbi:hypothetical protein GEMRC1_005872 [Eukaryota sp. GEM-RC1]
MAPPKKRSRRDWSAFIDSEAEDVEEEEEEELEAEDGYVSPTDENAVDSQLYQPRQRPTEQYFEDLASRYAEEVERETTAEVIYPVEEYQQGPRMKQKRPPQASDPRLWLVKVLPGHEQMAVMQVITKHFNTAANPLSPGRICSAIASPFAKGFIYIEAYKSSDILTAVEGLRSIIVNAYNNKPLFWKQRKEALDVAIGSFVRVLRGAYKNDLGRVVDYDPGSGKAVLQLVPRFTYDPDKRKRRITSLSRPPPKLFDQDEASRSGLITEPKTDPYTGEEFISCGGQRFTAAGFLLKSVNVSGFTFITNVTPELVLMNPHFAQQLKEVVKTRHVTADVAIGDTVKVRRGELRGLKGRIVSEPKIGTVIVVPQHSEVRDPIEFSKNDLVKVFEVGDRVKVTGGEYVNETGFIVSVDERNPELVVIMSDLNRTEFTASSNNLKTEGSVSTSQVSLGKFSARSAVTINLSTVGFVINIENGMLICLLNTGIVQHYSITQVKEFKTHASALDGAQQIIKPGDHVIVNEGPYSNKSGRVLCIFKSFLFLDCPAVTDNSGIIVVAARVTKNTSVAQSSENAFPITTPSPVHSNLVGQKPRAKKPMARGQVKILKKEFKGYKGIIISATDTEVVVQLPAVRRLKNKTTTLPREYIQLIDDEVRGRAADVIHQFPRTPAIAPGFSSMAPATPYVGSGAGSVWDQPEQDNTTPVIDHPPVVVQSVLDVPQPVEEEEPLWCIEKALVTSKDKVYMISSINHETKQATVIAVDNTGKLVESDTETLPLSSLRSKEPAPKDVCLVVSASDQEKYLEGRVMLAKSVYGQDVILQKDDGSVVVMSKQGVVVVMR